MKQRIRNFLTTVLFYSGFCKLLLIVSKYCQVNCNTDNQLQFPFIKRRRSRNVQILVYHRVNDDDDLYFPAVTTGAFDRQMDYLATNYRVCALEEIVPRLAADDVPDKAVVVTFDDGYRDNYTHAFPILKRYEIPATIFLATEAIGTGRVLWNDRVFSAFRRTSNRTLKGVPPRNQAMPLKSIEEKLAAQRQVLEFLWSLDHAERLHWIQRLTKELAVLDDGEATNLMLSWDEVRAMHGSGIRFGSHTHTHPILSRLPIAALEQEIQGSKKIIEQALRCDVNCFAYPVGRQEDFNSGIKQILKESGYLCAVTTVFGVNRHGSDLFELRRATPWQQELSAFSARLAWYKFAA